MLFWFSQEELSEGVRKVEGVSRKETHGKPEWLSDLVHLYCKVAGLFVWDMSCERFVSWQKCCLFRQEA